MKSDTRGKLTLRPNGSELGKHTKLYIEIKPACLSIDIGCVIKNEVKDVGR
jgi:hypothetical protein